MGGWLSSSYLIGLTECFELDLYVNNTSYPLAVPLVLAFSFWNSRRPLLTSLGFAVTAAIKLRSRVTNYIN